MSPLLYQHITDMLFESLSVSTDGSTSTGDTQDSGLTYEEESAIHYVGGYVIRELKLDKANVHPLLELLTYSESSLVDDDPMRDWVSMVNRGGLTRITNEAFGVFMILNFTEKSKPL